MNNEKILVVDDERTFLEVAREIFTGMGYQVLLADNGKKALKIAAAESPHVILLDVVMPGKNGFEVCRELKRGKKTKGIYIIIMSGKTSEIEQGFDHGADDCIPKPLNWSRLAEKIKEI